MKKKLNSNSYKNGYLQIAVFIGKFLCTRRVAYPICSPCARVYHGIAVANIVGYGHNTNGTIPPSTTWLFNPFFTAAQSCYHPTIPAGLTLFRQYYSVSGYTASCFSNRCKTIRHPSKGGPGVSGVAHSYKQ